MISRRRFRNSANQPGKRRCDLTKTPYHVACPLCGATPMQRCETRTGYYSPPHDARWKAAGIAKLDQENRWAAWRFYEDHISPNKDRKKT